MRVALEGFEAVIADGLGGGVTEIKFRAERFECGELRLQAVVGLIIYARCGILILQAIMFGDFDA